MVPCRLAVPWVSPGPEELGLLRGGTEVSAVGEPQPARFQHRRSSRPFPAESCSALGRGPKLFFCMAEH